jgi:exodeoxyribonuclease V beta subunit
MNKPGEIKTAHDIDLSCHGVIEAHAGTGKTFTIVQMVVRILGQPVEAGKRSSRFIHIREILLVTYTEKAAGELKRRIRDGIEERIEALRANGRDNEDGLAGHLEDCLNNLHEALIGTIHAVCLRLLRTWPFESGAHFAAEIVDDEEGLENALRESMRTDWQNADTLIPWALELIQMQGRKLEPGHFELLRKTAKELLDREHVELDRTMTGGLKLQGLADESAGINSRIDTAIVDFYARLDTLISALQKARDSGKMAPDRLELLNERLPELIRIKSERRLGTVRGKYTPPAYILRATVPYAGKPYDNFFSGFSGFDLKILNNPCKVGRSGIYTKPDIAKIPFIDEADRSAETVRQHALVKALGEREAVMSRVTMALLCDAAEILADRWNGAKREKGYISFRDMLHLMHRAVRNNPALVSALRARLRYAIIDEFQDTSLVQWEIVRQLFLAGAGDNAPRMFIVGDPKQSIYSFQGADVRSYLNAKRELLDNHNGREYTLTRNFRSNKETLDGCNAIVASQGREEDWFCMGGQKGKGISYPIETAASAPEERTSQPVCELPCPAVQVMALEGSAPKRRSDMARHACAVIKTLHGTVLSVPDGLTWNNRMLDYEDFAIIVEAHRHADFFLDAFRDQGIPAVKYKMEGVFQSPMARDLIALLRAITHRESAAAPRLAALLTHFFNRMPGAIDPERDLEPCSRGAWCAGDEACIAHALQEWTGLADRLLWAQLFRGIQVRTGVRERLMRLRDGERHLADLRQVIDYGMEKLCRDNLGLVHLVEHLGRLYREEERIHQDRNLHVLATQKSSVKVLTMHAAKGLEFPVVFVATGGSRAAPKGPNVLGWTTGDGGKKVMPYFSISDARMAGEGDTPVSLYLEQAEQERRRLLYVALTRAQALLFVPMHYEEIIPGESGAIQWTRCKKPGTANDDDLTPRLGTLLEGIQRGTPLRNVALFDEYRFRQPGIMEKDAQLKAASPSKPRALPDIAALELASRVCRQTSYTQLSRQAATAREIDRSEEEDEDSRKDAGPKERVRPDLPGGRRTGDALHLVIEELLHSENINDAMGRNNEDLEKIVERRFANNGILHDIARYSKSNTEVDERRKKAVACAAMCIQGALSAAIELPGGGTIEMRALHRIDRIAEMEFMLGATPHWVHGYMDLVFRVENNAVKKHPYRYYVLDWKSDTIETFDARHLDECIHERHYDLQARLYCHALDTYLKGVLGDGYDPAENIGGAVYVFLRGFDGPDGENRTCLWTRKAEPENDREYVEGLVKR